MTALTEVSLEERIRLAFDDATFVKAFDISGGCGASFEVVIVSPSFEGQTTLKRHRLVNAKLKDEIAALHAFTQKTYTPKQFENVRIAGVAPAPGMATADQPADPALAPP